MRSNSQTRPKKPFSLTTIKYFITETVRGIVRNSLMSISSASCVAACIFIVVFSVSVALNIDHFLTKLENTAGISVFLDISLSGDELSALSDEIKSIEHVKSVDFVSQKDALASMGNSEEAKNALRGFAEENPLENPLRPSFTVKLDNIRNQEAVVNFLNSANIYSRGIVKVNDTRVITDILIGLNKIVRLVSVAIILILGLLSVVIVMNTIKITVNNRKNEIKIMKYVGATNWFIKFPFMLEGIVIGVAGALLPVIIGFLCYDGVVKMVEGNLPSMISSPGFKPRGSIFPILTPVMLFLGAGLGALGSLSSMKRHLDV